jgi:hypothetical protein
MTQAFVNRNCSTIPRLTGGEFFSGRAEGGIVAISRPQSLLGVAEFVRIPFLQPRRVVTKSATSHHRIDFTPIGPPFDRHLRLT